MARFWAVLPDLWLGCSHRRRSAATAVGAGIGAVAGRLSKRHAEKKMGVELEEYLPPGSSAVVAVVDDEWADKVEAALVGSDKRINKAIDSGDYDELQKAFAKSSDEVSGAITEQAQRLERAAHQAGSAPAVGQMDVASGSPRRRRSFAGGPRGQSQDERHGPAGARREGRAENAFASSSACDSLTSGS